ncbi:MAG: PAS domain-containing protein, partial [bacterium]|nr:PAS domain-containing protein [bacterium]
MYEPYPYKLDKIKISTFFLVVILLIAGIFILRRHPLLLNFSPLALTVLDYFCLFMLCLAGILSFRNYWMQYSREYFYIGTTAVAALLFRMFFSYLYRSEIGFEIQQQIQLGSGLLFAIGFLLAAITSGEKVTINDRKKFVLRQWGILLGISLALAYAFFRFLSHSAVARIGVFRPTNLIAGLIAVLFLSAMMITIYSYFKLRHVLFFWYAIAGLLLSGAAFFVIFQQSDQPAWGGYLLWNFAGLLAIGWLLLSENPKSMEAEIDLRNDLEKTLIRQQKRLENLQSLIDELQAGVCAVDRSGKITFANQGFIQLVAVGKKQYEGKNIQELFDARNQPEYQLAADKLHNGNPVQFEIEIRTGRGGNIPVIISANPVRGAMGR